MIKQGEKVMKKVFYFVILCLYVLGTIGGVGYTIYYGAWPVAVGVACLAWMAFPKAMECFNGLTE